MNDRATEAGDRASTPSFEPNPNVVDKLESSSSSSTSSSNHGTTHKKMIILNKKDIILKNYVDKWK